MTINHPQKHSRWVARQYNETKRKEMTQKSLGQRNKRLRDKPETVVLIFEGKPEQFD